MTAQITTIRPALIVECLVHEMTPSSVAKHEQFFDADWREHPAGLDGDTARGVRAVARTHGGRVDVKPAPKGCQVTFVVPRIEG